MAGRDTRDTDAHLDQVRKEAMAFAGIGLYRYTFDGIICSMDEVAVRIFELEGRFPEPDGVVGRNISEIVIHQRPPGHLRELVRRQRRVRGYHSSFKTLKGTQKHAQHDSYLIKEPGTGREVIQVVIHDITERRQAEDALRQSEQQYRSMFEAVSESLIIFDPEGRIVAANPAACRTYDYSLDELIRLSVDDLAPEGQDQFFRELCLRANAGGRHYGESTGLRRDGTTFEAEVLGSSFVFRGKPHLLAAIHDVSERKRELKERHRLEEHLRRAQKAESIGRFAAGIAHDFNNLLAPIIGYTEMILKDLPPDAAQHRALEHIHEAGERAKTLIRQLLTFGRKQELNTQVLELNCVVAESESILRRLIREDIDMRTIASPEPCIVKADRSQLDQILMNLAVNAQDAMPGGGALTIEVSNLTLDEKTAAVEVDGRPGAYALLTVTDDGGGMDAVARERAFEPFYTTKGEDKGTGLGLATVYGIVKRHGGGIAIDSEPGRGTAIRIYLPRLPVAEESSPPSSPAEPGGGGTETILIAEDEEPVLTLVREILTAHGYNVLAAGGPEEALALARGFDGTIHLLLTDVVMPKMDGRELHEELSRVRPETKTLYMSGYAEDVIGQHGVLGSEVHILRKPFSVTSLTHDVRRALDR